MSLRFRAVLLSAVTALLAPAASWAIEPAACQKLFADLSQKMTSTGDVKIKVLINQVTKSNQSSPREFLVFRRPSTRSLMLLTQAPKVEAGQGYLRLEQNVWFYDPSVGRWERHTERDRIAGTDLRTRDFDDPGYDRDYNITCDSDEQIKDKNGKAHRIVSATLTAKPGVEVSFPKLKLWVDPVNVITIKEEAYADSGKKLRTGYMKNWKRIASPEKKGDIWYPGEGEYIDELSKGASTSTKVEGFDPTHLEDNQFTKAWLESKSR